MPTETHDAQAVAAELSPTQAPAASALLFQQRLKALARWDNEGGAGPDGPQRQDMPDVTFEDTPAPGDAELIQPHIRVIALESLMIGLLAHDVASMISPRAGSTQHSLTLQAMRQMVNMIERAEHFRSSTAA